MVLARILAASLLKELYGAKHALLAGFSLSMPLTLLVAVATIGHDVGLLEDSEFYQLVLASIFEVLIVMPLIKYLASTLHKEAKGHP